MTTPTPGTSAAASVEVEAARLVLAATTASRSVAVLHEAVSNAVRHAAASELVVTICVGDHLVIDVSDNGIGIPDIVARSGLHNLHHRAAEAGGECTVEHLGNGGTRPLWTAPLPIEGGRPLTRPPEKNS